jgi:hypothetical protein
MPVTQPKIELLGKANIADHGLTSFTIHTMVDGSTGQPAFVSPVSLKAAAGVQDADHLLVDSVEVTGVIHNAHDPAAVQNIVLCHGNDEPLMTASRVGVISNRNKPGTCELTHGMALAHRPHTTQLQLAPSSKHVGTLKSEMARGGVVRQVRWRNLSPGHVSIDDSHDIETHSQAGHEDRHTLPLEAAGDSSPLVKLFDLNKDNDSFLNGAYTTDKRVLVPMPGDEGDKFVVKDADLKAATSALQSHLKPHDLMHEGLKVHVSAPPGHPVAPGAQTHVTLKFNRTPLTAEQMIDPDAQLKHDVLTVADLQTAMGETVDSTPLAVAIAGGGVEEVTNSIMELELPE